MSEERRTLAELARRRGLFFPANEAYGGTAGFYVYGPAGAAVKRNVEDAWRDRFAIAEGNMEIDAPTVMPEPVFEASGHLAGFDDMLVECGECGESHRADHVVEDATDIEDAESLGPARVGELIAEHDLACPTCGAPLAGRDVSEFNLMFGTNIGPGSSSPGYLRPETAQGIFVEFPRLKEYARAQLPFGVTQVGRAYRNEISPRRGLVRVREFTQAELELFVDPERDAADLSSVADVPLRLYPAVDQGEGEPEYVETTVAEAVADDVVGVDWIAYYLGVAREWYAAIGVDMDRFRFRQHLPGERAHYAADCWDAEAEVGGDWVEIAGFASRGDYDLSAHAAHGDADFTVFRQYDEPTTVERATVDPDMSVLGPEFGSAAGAVADALAERAEVDPAAFDGESVTVEVDGESYTVPVEASGFGVETVTESGEHVTPHVIEPSFGVDRTVYTVLAHALSEDEVDGEARTRLALPPAVASTFVGVFPLMDRDGLGERARAIASRLRDAGFAVAHDDSGSIGRRYRRQDEVGTPYCLTVDYRTLEDDTATLRERDTAAQVRLPTDGIRDEMHDLKTGASTFDDLADRFEVVEGDAETPAE